MLRTATTDHTPTTSASADALSAWAHTQRAPLPDPCGSPRLTADDEQALCAALSLPLPTPDVPLTAVLSMRGYTPETAWAALSTATDVRTMIAAAALRGRTRVCPPDPRLRPAPHRAAPVARPTTPAEAQRSPVVPAATAPSRPTPEDSRVVLTVAPNPKRAGSAAAARYAAWTPGHTIAQCLAAGLTRGDVRWDTDRGFVVVGDGPDAQGDGQ